MLRERGNGAWRDGREWMLRTLAPHPRPLSPKTGRGEEMLVVRRLDSARRRRGGDAWLARVRCARKAGGDNGAILSELMRVLGLGGSTSIDELFQLVEGDLAKVVAGKGDAPSEQLVKHDTETVDVRPRNRCRRSLRLARGSCIAAFR